MRKHLLSSNKYLVKALQAEFEGYQMTEERVIVGKFDQSMEEDVNQTL